MVWVYRIIIKYDNKEDEKKKKTATGILKQVWDRAWCYEYLNDNDNGNGGRMSMKKVIKGETENFRSHKNRGNRDGIVKYCDK